VFTTNKIDKQYLIGHWIAEYIYQYLLENKSRKAEKVLLKIENISYEFAPSILKVINELKTRFEESYDPVVKTVSPIEGFDEFACKDHETSVWLRNFVKPGQALILLLNKKTPEAQSLKDIVSVDEAQLLSSNGFLALSKMLTQYNLLKVSEVNELHRFLEVYQTITDSQLSLIISFLEGVINSNTNLMISERIGDNLIHLKLFRDTSLRTEKKEVLKKSLGKNYYLSNLRKNNVSFLDPDKMMQSVDRFVQNEQRNGMSSDIWKVFGKDESALLEKAFEFVHRKNNGLLTIPIEMAEKIFDFKVTNRFKDRLLNVREKVLNDMNDQIINANSFEEKSNLELEKQKTENKFDQGLEAVLDKKSLENVRDFREDFSDYLEQEGIIKTIVNIENKLENPAVYVDLLEGILSEVIVMIEKIEDEDFNGNISIMIRKSDKEILSLSYIDFFNYHLQSLSLLSNNIVFEKLNTVDADSSASLPEILSFEVDLIKNEEKIDSTSFKVETTALEMENNSFFDFYYELKENSKMGYITVDALKRDMHLLDNELCTLHATSELGDRKLISHIESFREFESSFYSLLRQSIDFGVTPTILKSISKLVEDYLDNSYSEVSAVRKVHGLINKIGVIEKISTNKQTGAKSVKKKIVSLFNPIRFISYGYKLVHYNNLIAKLTNTSEGINVVRTIEDIQQYKFFENSKMNKLAPAYQASGEHGVFYFEQEESYGQGIYVTEEFQESDSNQANYFAIEMTKIVNDYIRVYPFASDCLDILFLYVTNLDYVRKTIETILRKETIKKLNVTIHSPSKAAVIYDELNKWLGAKEDYVTPIPLLGGLPRLEINVLPNHMEVNLEKQISKSMIDFDIAIFVDYFGQKHNLNIPKSFFDIPIEKCELEDDSWRTVKETGYRSSQEGTRLINYVSHVQPKLFQKYYELQYVLQSGIAVREKETVHILRGEIQVTQTEKNALYNIVHEKFNWVVTYDRYMDPMLVNQVTNKANIIRYHIDRKGKDEVKVLVSSSDTVRRFLDKKDNYYYHQRLSNRLKDLLGIKDIDETIVRDIIHKVKQLSGGSVLRSLGPGKFIHELLSVYLTVSQIETVAKDEVVLWSMCDELEWFRKNQKRPDLLKLIIKYNHEENKYMISLNLIELKLVHYNSYETEVLDAEIQLNSGEKTLKAFFDFDTASIDAEMRLQSLIMHLIETRSYDNRELSILGQLQNVYRPTIEFKFEKEINAYIYSQDVKFEGKQYIKNGHYENQSDFGDITVRTFTRSYILEAFKVENDLKQVSIDCMSEDITSFEEYILDKQGDVTFIKEEIDQTSEIDQVNVIQDETINRGNNISSSGEVKTRETTGTDNSNNIEGTTSEIDDEIITSNENDELDGVERDKNSNYPEIEALYFINKTVNDEDKRTKDEQLGQMYGQILRSKFNINNIQFMVERTIVGANVIRVIGNIPPTQSIASIEKKTKDMALWLKIDAPPTVFSDKNGINIDINRPEPETVYFDEFMRLVRKQITADHVNSGFIVPIGVDPLNKVMTVDFNGTEPHMLVAGSTGSGKSVSVNSIVLALMCIYQPEDLKFVFIDPKQVEFSVFEGSNHTLNVSTEINSASDYLDIMVNEMERRYTQFSKEMVKNLKEYNDLMKSEGRHNEVLPRLLVVFDEFADFMMQGKEFAKRIENTISRIGQKGRAAGLHMIVCTQSPKAEIINTTIKNNLLARLGLKVPDSIASNVVLDTSGAENLAGKGDYLLKTNGDPIRGKSPYLQPEAYRALLKFFKK
jgi:DNA segregation ATPase FtsK/SpoIIIE, S-DNA-T family